MSIKNGVKQYVHVTIAKQHEINKLLLSQGIEPEKAADCAAMVSVMWADDLIEKRLGDLNAAQITSHLNVK
ncbi:hypothetical protein GRJ22_18265 [Photobacterium carnosum]|uniref:hypothetical protein n=1 Tax=Photobacterium carnosum TaxID=2023717 RepID=UPI001E5ABD1A|nr:hypothetical protein [Photobacterium carnosum]MCD9558318.1 hypothetical protein [Photobacterium carnosum]